MEQRWTLSFNDGATWPSTVVPLNGSKLTIVQERDLENGQIFFRKKINSAIRFGKGDYQQFLDIERQGASRCNTILVRVELKCANTWQELWRGKFSTGSGKFELDRCVFEVKPDTVDRYTCMLEIYDNLKNVLEVSPTPIEAFFPGPPIPFVRPYDFARYFEEVAQFLVDELDCDLGEVQSDFFEWNAPGTAPGYSPGINYVTGGTNQLDRLYILQKTDAIGVTPPSNEATIGEMSLKQMFSYLRSMFNVYWDIDDDGNIRIEHWKYWVFPVGIDVRTFTKNIEPFTYNHLSLEIPRYEKFKWAEAGGVDFIGKDIVYSGPCVLTDGRDAVKETAIPITTDWLFLVSAGNTVAPNGFAVFATATNSPSPDLVINATGALTGNTQVNAPLSWANLHRDYFTWNRYLQYGNMNGVDVQFDGWQPNIEQEGVGVPLCCDILTFDPKDQIVSRLGQAIGNINAVVEEAEYSLHDYRLRMKLRYSY